MGVSHKQTKVQQKHYMPFILRKEIGTKKKIALRDKPQQTNK